MTNEEAKQQFIREAWGVHYQYLEPFINDEGKVFKCMCPDKYQNIFGDVFFDNLHGYWWPKSLNGIENNNGWTRLEPDGSNLPNEIIKLVFINTFGKNEIITFTNDRQCLRYYSTRYTHFKVFKPELKPLY